MKKFIVFILLTLTLLSCTKQIDYSKDINELKTQLGFLQSQINQLQRTTDSLNNELKITKLQVNVVSGKIDSLYKRIDVVSSQILNLTTELNSKFTQLSNQIASDKTDITKTITDLINKISEYQKELSELTKQINAVKNEIVQNQGYEIIPVDPQLKSNGKGLITVPVVIINYIPTVDNVYIDTARAYNSNQPWNETHKYTLVRARNKILTEKIIQKHLCLKILKKYVINFQVSKLKICCFCWMSLIRF
jgi:septal ring factor EnvC (AmiA/AmiB activator)